MRDMVVMDTRSVELRRPDGEPVRILVVDDEPTLTDLLTMALRYEGWDVRSAATGNSAVRTAKEFQPDAVVLDVMLPDLDGLEVLRRLRGHSPDVPVLFLTARDAVSDRVRGLNGGADDYLCKPFAFEELLARVRILARRREQPDPAVVRHLDVTLDLATQRAERAGQRLDLTAKEQALLMFFLRHPGEVLSRTRIYEHVWDDRYDGLSNTLEVHVMGLRRKLETHGPRLIHTLRGRGYVFGEPPGAARTEAP
jgi:DNA-binding response OmpR family regulator